MGELVALIFVAFFIYWVVKRVRGGNRQQGKQTASKLQASRPNKKDRKFATHASGTDPNTDRRTTVINRHFELNQQIEIAKAAGDFDRVLDTARQSVDQVREFVVAWNEQRLEGARRSGRSGDDLEWQVVKMPALEAIHQIAPARCERELIERARDVIADVPAMEDELAQLARDLEDADACQVLLRHLSANPGVKQAGMARGLGLDGHRVRSLLHWMERDNEIVRVPVGDTHCLYLPPDAPEIEQEPEPPSDPGLKVGLEPISVELAAVDVETATSERSSACAIAVALVSDGQVTDTRRWYVRPPDNVYRATNVKIHGIQPHDTAEATEFPQVWQAVQQHIDGLEVVAHNAPFDASVIRSSLERYRAPAPPALELFCTCQIARRLWPELDNHTLPLVSAHCGARVERHHDPVADAVASANIAIAICSTLGVDSIRQAGELTGRRPS